MDTFTKKPGEPQSALAEAAGLCWLREASEAVAHVISADAHHIRTARVVPARPTPAAARTAGRELARIHLAGAPAFGAPPPGWEGPNYIGTQPQECTPVERWSDFYPEQRVLPFAHTAYRRSHLHADGLRTVQVACGLIREHDFAGAPARLHGDLWNGNLLFGADGPILIDPAAHGGHPETDLAMLALFGAPYLEEIRAGYAESNLLEPGWLERTPMHQLHPLAVHAASQGPAYGVALEEAAMATITLLSG